MSKGYIVPDVNTFPPPPEPNPAPTPRTDWVEARVWDRYKQAEDITPEDNARSAIGEACEHARALERELTEARATLLAREGELDAMSAALAAKDAEIEALNRAVTLNRNNWRIDSEEKDREIARLNRSICVDSPKMLALNAELLACAEKAEAADSFSRKELARGNEIIDQLRIERDQLRAEVERLRGPDDTGDDSLSNVRRLRAELAAAEKAIRKGSEDALYMRDDLLKQLAAAKEDTERLENLIRAVENTLSNIPAYHEGDFIVMHYDGEGRELGPEYIDPFCVVGHIDQSLRAAIDDARSKESDTAG